MNNDNGLEISTIQSSTKNLGDFKLPDNESFMSVIMSNFEGNGYCVCYLDYKVLIGEYNGSSFRFHDGKMFEPRFIQRMRLFDKIQKQELYIWRKNNGWFSGRLRVDGKGKKTDVVEAYQVLWGTNCEHVSGFTRLYEDRGTELFLPFENMAVDKNEKKAFIKTYNYISYETEGNLNLFSWDEIPGNDNGRLIEYLNRHFAIEWVKTAEIEKIDDGGAIKVSTGINFLSLSLNDEKTKVDIRIDDGRTDKFIVKTKNGELNIYGNSYQQAGYVDCRFVAFTDNQRKILGVE